MSEQIIYQHCPACDADAIYPALSVKDYSVTGEIFEVWHCEDCTLRFTQNTPDAANILRYYQSANYISHTDTDKGLINRLYHLVRNYTLTVKRKLLLNVIGKGNRSLLDIGAGTGAFLHIMQQAGWEVTGLEPDLTARQNAKNKYGLILQPTDNLNSIEAEGFDAITLWHVLEHVHDFHGYLSKFHKILKPSGSLIIALPNYLSFDAKEYKEYWAAYDVPRHLYHFSPKSMEQLANTYGFVLQETKPMWFDSFYVSMLSEQYKNEGGNLIGAVWNGLLSNLKCLGNAKKSSSVIYIFSKNNS